MSQLFDTSPIEDEDGKKKRPSRRKAAAPEPQPQAATEPDDALATLLAKPAVTLGRLDGVVECHRCGAATHDIIEDYGREWMIECCFCGLKQDVPSIKGHLKPRGKAFVMSDGRFAGKTLDEIVADPRGMDYITWASKEHKRQTVREACAKYLLTAGDVPL